MTEIYYRTEILEDGRTLDLIAIGLVREDGGEYYAVNADADWKKISGNRRLCENVVPALPLSSKGVRKETPASGSGWTFSIDLSSTLVRPCWVIANEVREFILAAGDPELWADHCAYDHVALCQLWGTMARLPGGIPMWTHSLRQEVERAGNPAIPAPGGPTGRSALDSAREVRHRRQWLREQERPRA